MANKQVVPYQDKKSTKKVQIRNMFDGISSNYDLLNRVISGGIDIKWRKKVVALLLPKKPKKILDIATGTGDLAIELVKTKADEIIGVDISAGMLDIGIEKVKKRKFEDKIKMEIGDSEKLGYPNEHFDAATVAFGVRNFEDLDKGLSEIHRVLKPGGDLVVLETAVPQKFPFRQFYYFYTHKVMPILGSLFSRDKAAYRYLSDSAAAFPFGIAFNNILKKNGFIEVEDLPQTFGVASIYCAKKPK
tara:strand:+ start:1442 stop:2179 length:738 start_codon:yes stop_codon:yes gene_type:complete